MKKSNKAEFPAIYVGEMRTANNVLTQEIAIHFESGDMFSCLIMKPDQAEDLVIGLNKSLKRLKEREQ